MSTNAAQDEWRARAASLVEAIQDVRGIRSTYTATVVGPEHRRLFERYVADLRQAKVGAEKRWDAMIAAEFGRAGDLSIAERTVAKRLPVGRAADPGVLAVVRRYWLECEALNARVLEHKRVRAEELLLQRLVDSPDEDLARFLSDLPYWPIGLDPDGRWV